MVKEYLDIIGCFYGVEIYGFPKLGNMIDIWIGCGQDSCTVGICFWGDVGKE